MPDPCSDLVLGGQGGNVTATVADALSGPVNSIVSAPANVSSAGPKTVQLTGSDGAGNPNTVSCHYVVGYNVLGFYSPLPQATVKAGSTVPVKLALANAAGITIPDAEASALAGACAVTVTIAGGAPTCLEYNASGDRFQANPKAPDGPPGPATIVAKVTLGGEVINTLSTSIVLK